MPSRRELYEASKAASLGIGSVAKKIVGYHPLVQAARGQGLPGKIARGYGAVGRAAVAVAKHHPAVKYGPAAARAYVRGVKAVGRGVATVAKHHPAVKVAKAVVKHHPIVKIAKRLKKVYDAKRSGGSASLAEYEGAASLGVGDVVKSGINAVLKATGGRHEDEHGRSLTGGYRVRDTLENQAITAKHGAHKIGGVGERSRAAPAKSLISHVTGGSRLHAGAAAGARRAYDRGQGGRFASLANSGVPGGTEEDVGYGVTSPASLGVKEWGQGIAEGVKRAGRFAGRAGTVARRVVNMHPAGRIALRANDRLDAMTDYGVRGAVNAAKTAVRINPIVNAVKGEGVVGNALRKVVTGHPLVQAARGEGLVGGAFRSLVTKHPIVQAVQGKGLVGAAAKKIYDVSTVKPIVRGAVAAVKGLKKAWDESKHQRSHGKFASLGGGASRRERYMAMREDAVGAEIEAALSLLSGIEIA